jgi:hypothetical protein
MEIGTVGAEDMGIGAAAEERDGELFGAAGCVWIVEVVCAA